MAERTKTRDITIVEESGTFNTFLKRFTGSSSEYDFDSLALVRKLLNKEKARLIHIIKTKNPKSLYELAKILGRNFKSVSDDVKLLKRFGFIEMVSEKTGKRYRLKPILVVDTIHINIKI